MGFSRPNGGVRGALYERGDSAMKRIFILALAAFAQVASAQNRSSWDVPKSGPAIDVIVRFTHSPTKDDLKLLGAYGQVKKMLDVVNAVHISLTPAMIQELSTNPN